MFKKMVLVGVGLIGGSLSQDLLKANVVAKVVGFDRNSKNLNYAERQKIISVKGRDLIQEIQQADIVVLATPVLAIEQLLVDLAPHIPKTTLVMDVGSTKERILKLADKHFPDGNFVGAHPMRGSEQVGAQASQEGLFVDGPCILVRGKTTKPKFAKLAKALWITLGAKVLELDAKNHDSYVAACSHLPHVLSFALMKSVASGLSPKELSKVAGNSFKSYTRIAGSDARMWTDIFLDNQRNTLSKIKSFRKELDKLESLIASKNDSALFDYMEETAKLWRKI